MRTSQNSRRFVTVVLFSLGLILAAFTAASACDIYHHKPPCGCGCGCSTCPGGSGGSGPPKAGLGSSGHPVWYADGEIQMSADDLGNGTLWGHTRSYSNRFPNDNSFGNGCRWCVRQWPLLVKEGASIMVLFDPRTAYWFNPAGGAMPRAMEPSRLLSMIRPTTCTVWRSPMARYGSSPNSGRTAVLRRPCPTGFLAGESAPAARRLPLPSPPPSRSPKSPSAIPARDPSSSTTMRTSQRAIRTRANWRLSPSAACPSPALRQLPVRQVAYDYYVTSPTETNGLTGDLKTATCYYAVTFDANHKPVGSGTSDEYYYRYYTTTTATGFAHGLKYAFLPQAFNNLAANVSDWASADERCCRPLCLLLLHVWC